MVILKFCPTIFHVKFSNFNVDLRGMGVLFYN